MQWCRRVTQVRASHGETRIQTTRGQALSYDCCQLTLMLWNMLEGCAFGLRRGAINLRVEANRSSLLGDTSSHSFTHTGCKGSHPYDAFTLFLIALKNQENRVLH